MISTLLSTRIVLDSGIDGKAVSDSPRSAAVRENRRPVTKRIWLHDTWRSTVPPGCSPGGTLANIPMAITRNVSPDIPNDYTWAGQGQSLDGLRIENADINRNTCQRWRRLTSRNTDGSGFPPHRLRGKADIMKEQTGGRSTRTSFQTSTSVTRRPFGLFSIEDTIRSGLKTASSAALNDPASSTVNE